MQSRELHVETLIALVKRHPALYQPRDQHYTDYTHKEDIWNSIAQQMGADVQACKLKWGYLRDSYREAVKWNDGALTRKRKWPETSVYHKYAQQLRFLGRESVAVSEEPAATAAGCLAQETAESGADAAQRPAVDSFLASLAPALRRLPPELLAGAVAELSAVVHRYERLARAPSAEPQPPPKRARRGPRFVFERS